MDRATREGRKPRLDYPRLRITRFSGEALTEGTEAVRHFTAQADDFGVVIMVSGVVGSNNLRKLDPDEFRGFAIAGRSGAKFALFILRRFR